MSLRPFLPRANFRDRRDIYIALTVPALGFLAARLLTSLLAVSAYNGVLPKPRILRAPRPAAIPSDDGGSCPYPPDALPGGRDVDTPYGIVRAYEWGPSGGRKVLFIPGISTPCVALGRVASGLARGEGCRVMLFDLYGRGYSDAPDPHVVRQDVQLFFAQIMAVLASAEEGGWMEGFTLVGYSLGGGIAAECASYFPQLVRSLVLITPGGLLRPTRISASSKVLYSGLLPDWLVHHWVGWKLRAGGSQTNLPKTKAIHKDGKIDVTDAVVEELPADDAGHAKDSESPLFDDRPEVSSATAVAWQIRAHPGFIPSFVSSLRYGPVHDGFERWRTIGKRCDTRRSSGESAQGKSKGLDENKVLIILGLQDVVIPSEEIANDATTALGKDNVQVVRLQGGHDVPIMNSDGCVQAMANFWAGAT